MDTVLILRQLCTRFTNIRRVKFIFFFSETNLEDGIFPFMDKQAKGTLRTYHRINFTNASKSDGREMLD